MSKKYIIIILFLLLIILISLYNTLILIKQKNEINKYIEYINSDYFDTELQTPKYMHVLLESYQGDVEGTNILKSIFYSVNNVIPNISKNCRNIINTKIYYKTHKIQIQKQIGIDNFKEFNELVKKCRVIEESDKIEYIKFDIDNIKKTDDGVSAIMHVKYTNSEELKFNIKILNEKFSDKTSVFIK